MSALPDIPVISLVESLPGDLEAEVEKSVAGFTEKLGAMRFLPVAAEWVSEYRAEVEKMIRLGIDFGKSRE